MKTIWSAVAESLRSIERQLPQVMPDELPPETDPDFWFQAAKLEMRHRDGLSAAIRLLLTGVQVPDMTPLEGWLFRRRIEWAGQIALAAAQRRMEPASPLAKLLEEVLIQSWEKDGCIGLWNHAERGGKPHPENPDGLTPLG